MVFQMLKHLCESCFNGEVQIVTVSKPLYARSAETRKSQQLTTWCKVDFCYKSKLISKCKNYKPMPNKIQRIGRKKYIQKPLSVQNYQNGQRA